MSVEKIVNKINDIDKEKERLEKEIPFLVFYGHTTGNGISGASKTARFVPSGLNIEIYSEQTGHDTTHLSWKEIKMLKDFFNEHL